MSYATKQDLIDRFGAKELVELTDKVNRPASTIDDTTVDRALSDAASLIDGYLAKNYALPLTASIPMVTKAACDIARSYLHGKAADKDSPVTKSHDNALAWLEKVAKGLVVLEAEGVAAPQKGGGGVRVSAPNRVFTRETLRDL